MKDFFLVYWPAFLAALPAILIIARLVAKRTKTKVDDKAVEALSNIINATRGGKK